MDSTTSTILNVVVCLVCCIIQIVLIVYGYFWYVFAVDVGLLVLCSITVCVLVCILGASIDSLFSTVSSSLQTFTPMPFVLESLPPTMAPMLTASQMQQNYIQSIPSQYAQIPDPLISLADFTSQHLMFLSGAPPVIPSNPVTTTVRNNIPASGAPMYVVCNTTGNYASECQTQCQGASNCLGYTVYSAGSNLGGGTGYLDFPNGGCCSTIWYVPITPPPS